MGGVAIDEHGFVLITGAHHLIQFRSGTFKEFAYPSFGAIGIMGAGSLGTVAIGPRGGVWVLAFVPGGSRQPAGVILTLDPFKSAHMRESIGPMDTSFDVIAPAWDGEMWVIFDTRSPNNPNPSAVPWVFTAGPTYRGAVKPPIDLTYAEALGTDGLMYLATGPQLVYQNQPPSEIFRFNQNDRVVDTIDLPAGSAVQQMAVGPDGAMWFTDSGLNKIGRIATDGTVAYYSIPSQNAGLAGIAPAGDGAMWFTETSANKIGRISMSGTVAEYTIPTPNENPQAISAGPIGHYIPNAVYFVDSTGLGELVYRS